MKKIIFILISLKIFAADYLFENPFNKFTGDKIKEIAVIGERNTGSTFLKRLIKHNFPEIKICDNIKYENNEYSHKHFFPWFDLTEFGFHLNNFQQFPSLEYSKNCLFVCSVRDPLIWLRSFYNKPYHVDPALLGHGLLYFISHQWLVENHPLLAPDQWNPYEEREFKNILELRKFKNLNYLKIGKIVNNFMLINYENLVQSPLGFIQFLSDFFQLPNPLLINPESIFQPTIHPKLSHEEFEYIKENIDWEIESLIGYPLDSCYKRYIQENYSN